MKTFILKSIAILTISFFIFSCASEKKKADYLPDLVIEVPESLKDNADAVEFINASEETLNQWSVTFEDLVIECEPFAGKTEEELSTMDKLKLGKIMMEFMANMGQFAVKVSEMEQSITMIEDGLNEEESEALSVIMDTFHKRIEEIGAKYEDFGKEEANNQDESI